MAPDTALFHVLRKHGLPFVIIGGHAVIYHGYERTTADSDVVWMRSAESEVQLAAALEEINACRIGREIDPATGIEKLHPVGLPYIQANHLMMLWTRFGFLDLFDYIPGHPDVEPLQLLENTIEVEGFQIVSVDWLRKMKEKAGRDKDLVDLKKLSEQ